MKWSDWDPDCDLPQQAAGHELWLVQVELMQRIWANLYYDEAEAGFTFQQTLNDVVDWLAQHNAVPVIGRDYPRAEPPPVEED